MKPADALKPTPTVLCALGSIAVHVEEMLSPDGHAFDRVALNTLFSMPDLQEWLAAMRAMAMIPEKRNNPAPRPAARRKESKP